MYWVDSENKIATALYATDDFTSTKLELKNTVVDDRTELPVTRVAKYAFVKKNRLKEVVLPKNVMEIGDSAFYGTNVFRVNILGDVTLLKKGVFYNTSKTSGCFVCNLFGFEVCTLEDGWINSSIQKIVCTNVLSTNGYTEADKKTWKIKSGTLKLVLPETRTELEATSIVNVDSFRYVTLNRTLTAGKVYSFCSPFSFDVSDLGEGVLVAGFTDCDNGELVFDAVEKVEAGVPYLIRSDKDMNGIVVGATYVGALNDWNTLTTNKAVTKGSFTMTGNLYSMRIPTGDYYIKDGGFYPVGASQTVTSKAFRAVIRNSAPQNAQMRVRLNDGGESTVIDAVMTDEGTLEELVDVYTLSGQKIRQRVSFERLSPALKPGLYVVKGRKVLIR